MMKFILTNLKPVALFFSIIILFQGCMVYHKKPTSINQAIGPDKISVKVILSYDRKLMFDSLYYKNDALYGLMKLKNNQSVEIAINPENIKEIYLFDKSASILHTVFLGLGIGISIFFIWVWIALGQSKGKPSLPFNIS